MRVGGYARKRDANEAEIVTALERCGLLVQRISERGFCDLVVKGQRCGILLLEVKSLKGNETHAQIEHRQDGWPVIIVRSVDQALLVCGVTPRHG